MTTRVNKRLPQLKTPAEVEQFKQQKTAEVTKSADGKTVTKRRQTAKGSKELTTREGKLLDGSTTYRRRSSTTQGQHESTFVDQTDMVGRRSLELRKETERNNGDRHVQLETRDVFGIDKRATETHSERVTGDTTTTRASTTSRDSLGNANRSSDVTRVTERGETTVTTNRKDARGSELTTRSSTTYEGGVFRLQDGADWQKNTSFERSYLKETTFDAKPITDKVDKATPWVGKIFRALGIEETWSSQVPAENLKQDTLYSDANTSVTTRVGTSGGQSATIDSNGVRGQFNREAVAGVYVQNGNEVSGRYGHAGYTAAASAEARASVDAQGRIDSNGLDATVTARAGAKVEVQVTGTAHTQSVNVGGVPMDLGVDGRAVASAEVSAEATGTVRVTRNPPTAIAQGTVGASAVAKAEAEITANAGPFAVTASAYASAGAEATASGVIGYEDGKLKLGGSLGAALGVGAGANVQVEVDVAAIGEAAKGLADVDGNGELGFGDVVAAGRKAVDVGRTVARAADVNGDGKVGLGDLVAFGRNARSTAQNVASTVGSAVAHTAVRTAVAAGQTLHRAADVDGDGRVGLNDARAAASAATHAVANGARAASQAVASSARRVAGWFGF